MTEKFQITIEVSDRTLFSDCLIIFFSIFCKIFTSKFAGRARPRCTRGHTRALCPSATDGSPGAMSSRATSEYTQVITRTGVRTIIQAPTCYGLMVNICRPEAIPVSDMYEIIQSVRSSHYTHQNPYRSDKNTLYFKKRSNTYIVKGFGPY